MSRRRRSLKPEELELWQVVARSADRLKRPSLTLPNGAHAPTQQQPPRPAPKADQPQISRFEIGQKRQPVPETPRLPPTAVERLAHAPLQMDAKIHGRMTRGKLAPEARIDLHGMTLDQAHPALIRFIANASARGLRLVLVITGKGRRSDPHDPMPSSRGVLKRQVPVWLRHPPCGGMILQVTEAHISHGGAGAYYVYLRRHR